MGGIKILKLTNRFLKKRSEGTDYDDNIVQIKGKEINVKNTITNNSCRNFTMFSFFILLYLHYLSITKRMYNL